ncbi:luciferase-like monooxygenase [Pseudomonas putida S11]|nr:luciferase-like monooxygenase [Pseudomonas putida S11]
MTQLRDLKISTLDLVPVRADAGPDDFPDDVEELSRYLGPRTDDQKVIAVPGHDTEVPMWLLGSSLFSAQLAGMARHALRLRLAFCAALHARGDPRVPQPTSSP